MYPPIRDQIRKRQAEIEELAAVAGLLALAPPELDPPESLRHSVMSVVESEATRPRADRDRPASSWLGRFGWLGNVALGTAALLLVGLLSWNVLLREDVRDLRRQVEEARAANQAQETRQIELGGAWAERGARAEVTAIKDDRAIVVIEDMPSMPDDRTGQVWIIADDVPQPGGLLEPSGNMAATAITTSLSEADAIAITVEPNGGSSEPTTDPVLIKEL